MKYCVLLRQVKSGSIFDNIVVGDSLEEALQFGRDTFGKNKDAESGVPHAPVNN